MTDKTGPSVEECVVWANELMWDDPEMPHLIGHHPTAKATADHLTRLSAEVERLREALKEIAERGTSEQQIRIGDAYSANGWQTNTVVSAEAEIAQTALSPAPVAELRGLLEAAWRYAGQGPSGGVDVADLCARIAAKLAKPDVSAGLIEVDFLRIAAAGRSSNGCGLSHNGEARFCDDPVFEGVTDPAGRPIRDPNCGCKREARAIIDAYQDVLQERAALEAAERARAGG